MIDAIDTASRSIGNAGAHRNSEPSFAIRSGGARLMGIVARDRGHMEPFM
jgi:hypothetical protein